MSHLMGEQTFYHYCGLLKLGQSLIHSDPDKKQIEKAFRKCALKTHPDKVERNELLALIDNDLKGGNAVEFKKINDAYNRLMNHANAMEQLDMETELEQVTITYFFNNMIYFRFPS